MGWRVGLLDADIYGPSAPRLFGLSGKPEVVGNKMIPLEAYGIKIMSIGFLVEEDVPMVWRGPMVAQALGQMLGEVAWGELDALVVDMPPGTGDAQLTMAQQVPLAGAVVVSTPQDLALIDARRGVAMFQKVATPILGIIENMSYFLCPHCGGRTDIFSHGGARKDAEALGVPFLGEVPLDLDHSPDLGRRHAGRRLRAGRPACGDLQGARRQGEDPAGDSIAPRPAEDRHRLRNVKRPGCKKRKGRGRRLAGRGLCFSRASPGSPHANGAQRWVGISELSPRSNL